MPKSNTMIFMTSKSSKITPISDGTHGISSKMQGNKSSISHARHSWLTVIFGLIAVAGVLGTIVIAVVSFVILRSTTTTTTAMTTTTSKTTSTTSTTTDTMCYVPSSPRQSNIWVLVDSMSVARVYHAATLISQDNSVLITGGAYSSVITASVDRYIPTTGCFQPMRNMPRARYMHSADQLSSLSGYVVIAGGINSINGILGVADLYHPLTGDIVTVSLSSPRYAHKSAVLNSSQLVLIGGFNSLGAIVGSGDKLNTASNSAFVSATNTMNDGHVYHVVTPLGNNSDLVLVTGGFTGAVPLASTSLYHGSSNAFISLGSGATLLSGRYYHAATYLPSPLNKVLITGGAITGIIYQAIFLFDVYSLTMTNLPTTLITPRYFHTSTLLPNGKILIIGGLYLSVLNTCELIDPSNNYTVTSAANLITARYLHTATLIPDNNNGTVLVCGGYNSVSAAINSCELYFV